MEKQIARKKIEDEGYGICIYGRVLAYADVEKRNVRPALKITSPLEFKQAGHVSLTFFPHAIPCHLLCGSPLMKITSL